MQITCRVSQWSFHFAFQYFIVDLSFLFLLFFFSSSSSLYYLLTAVSVLVLLLLLNHPFLINAPLTISSSSVDHPLSHFFFIFFFFKTCPIISWSSCRAMIYPFTRTLIKRKKVQWMSCSSAYWRRDTWVEKKSTERGNWKVKNEVAASFLRPRGEGCIRVFCMVSWQAW